MSLFGPSRTESLFVLEALMPKATHPKNVNRIFHWMYSQKKDQPNFHLRCSPKKRLTKISHGTGGSLSTTSPLGNNVCHCGPLTTPFQNAPNRWLDLPVMVVMLVQVPPPSPSASPLGGRGHPPVQNFGGDVTPEGMIFKRKFSEYVLTYHFWIFSNIFKIKWPKSKKKSGSTPLPSPLCALSPSVDPPKQDIVHITWYQLPTDKISAR